MAINDALAVNYSGQKDDGQAFVLGKSSAADNYANSIKDIIKERKTQKALARSQASAFGEDVDLRKAWDVDIYGKGGLMEKKQAIKQKAAKLYQKWSSNPEDPSIIKDVQDLENDKADLTARVISSSQQYNDVYLPQAKDYVKNEANFDRQLHLDRSAAYKNVGVTEPGVAGDPIKRAQLEGNSAIFNIRQIDVPGFTKSFKIGAEKIVNEANNRKVTTKNLLYDEKGEPTEFYKTKFMDAANTMLDSDKGQRAVEYLMRTKDISADEAKHQLVKSFESQVATEASDVLASHNKATESQLNLNFGYRDLEKKGALSHNTEYVYNDDGGEVVNVSPVSYSHPKTKSSPLASSTQWFDANNGKPARLPGGTYEFNGGESFLKKIGNKYVPYERGVIVDLTSIQKDDPSFAYLSELSELKKANDKSDNPKPFSEIASEFLYAKGITDQKKIIRAVEVPLEQAKGLLHGSKVNTKAIFEAADKLNGSGSNKSYTIKGKSYSADAVAKAAKASNMSVDEYIKKANK